MGWLANFDAFSRPIMLMYKGSESHNTNLGGFASIITFFLLIVYSAQQIPYLWIEPTYINIKTDLHTNYASN